LSFGPKYSYRIQSVKAQHNTSLARLSITYLATMFKGTLYTVLALTMALTTLAAPAANPDAPLAKKSLIHWGETGGLGAGGEPLKKE